MRDCHAMFPAAHVEEFISKQGGDMPAVISNTPGHLQQYSQFAPQAGCICMKCKQTDIIKCPK